MAPTDPSDNGRTCPKCHQPLSPGVKFCETCGARIEQLPACAHCGAPLSPGVKFCESCGKPVAGPAPEQGSPVVAPELAEPEPPVQPPEPAEVTEPEPAHPESPEEPEPGPEAPTAPDEAEIPDERAEAEPPVEEPATSPSSAPQPAAVAGAGSSQKTLIIAGIVGFLIIAALAFFVLLPMLSGTSADGGNGAAAGATSTAASTMPATTPDSAAESFETLPTQRLPVNLEVVYQVERSPVNGIVTVTFSGGSGLNGIAETLITVTRSDGQVMTKSWKPSRIGDSVTVQGTVMTDRVEVITNFYNGESYRCFDEIFEYKKRV